MWSGLWKQQVVTSGPSAKNQYVLQAFLRKALKSPREQGKKFCICVLACVWVHK